MELDFTQLPQPSRYKLLTALVVPRPIGWITSLSATGVLNAAPYSFFNVLGNTPPIVAFGPSFLPDGSPKDTLRNVEATGEFVVNIVAPEAVQAMHQTAASYGPDVSEVAELGLETQASLVVRVPRLALSQVHLECRYETTVVLGQNHVVFGRIVHMHAPDDIVDPQTFHVRPGAFQAVGRLQGPGQYATTRDQLDLGPIPRPIRRPLE